MQSFVRMIMMVRGRRRGLQVGGPKGQQLPVRRAGAATSPAHTALAASSTCSSAHACTHPLPAPTLAVLHVQDVHWQGQAGRGGAGRWRPRRPAAAEPAVPQGPPRGRAPVHQRGARLARGRSRHAGVDHQRCAAGRERGGPPGRVRLPPLAGACSAGCWVHMEGAWLAALLLPLGVCGLGSVRSSCPPAAATLPLSSQAPQPRLSCSGACLHLHACRRCRTTAACGCTPSSRPPAPRPTLRVSGGRPAVGRRWRRLAHAWPLACAWPLVACVRLAESSHPRPTHPKQTHHPPHPPPPPPPPLPPAPQPPDEYFDKSATFARTSPLVVHMKKRAAKEGVNLLSGKNSTGAPGWLAPRSSWVGSHHPPRIGGLAPPALLLLQAPAALTAAAAPAAAWRR